MLNNFCKFLFFEIQRAQDRRERRETNDYLEAEEEVTRKESLRYVS